MQRVLLANLGLAALRDCLQLSQIDGMVGSRARQLFELLLGRRQLFCLEPAPPVLALRALAKIEELARTLFGRCETSQQGPGTRRVPASCSRGLLRSLQRSRRRRPTHQSPWSRRTRLRSPTFERLASLSVALHALSCPLVSLLSLVRCRGSRQSRLVLASLSRFRACPAHHWVRRRGRAQHRL